MIFACRSRCTSNKPEPPTFKLPMPTRRSAGRWRVIYWFGPMKSSYHHSTRSVFPGSTKMVSRGCTITGTGIIIRCWGGSLEIVKAN